MAKLRLIKDDDLIGIVELDSPLREPHGTSYPVHYVGYGDDVTVNCSIAWIDDQETIEELDYSGEVDYCSLYENIMMKRA